MIYSFLDMFHSSTSVLCLKDNQSIFGINKTCSSSSESKEIIYISCVAENHV